MIPGHRSRLNGSIAVCIGSGSCLHNRVGFEITISYFLKIIVEHPNHRMKLYENKLSARFQKVLNHGSPAIQVGKPANSSVRSENQIELSFQMLRKIKQITAYKSCICLCSLSQFTRFPDRFVGKICTNDTCTHASH
ncbi:hypothetical protein D3C80_1043960 [compost metagenome]